MCTWDSTPNSCPTRPLAWRRYSRVQTVHLLLSASSHFQRSGAWTYGPSSTAHPWPIRKNRHVSALLKKRTGDTTQHPKMFITGRLSSAPWKPMVSHVLLPCRACYGVTGADCKIECTSHQKYLGVRECLHLTHLIWNGLDAVLREKTS